MTANVLEPTTWKPEDYYAFFEKRGELLKLVQSNTTDETTKQAAQDELVDLKRAIFRYEKMNAENTFPLVIPPQPKE